MKGVAHYKKDGTKWAGGTHKMPNGELHSGKSRRAKKHGVAFSYRNAAFYGACFPAYLPR